MGQKACRSRSWSRQLLRRLALAPTLLRVLGMTGGGLEAGQSASAGQTTVEWLMIAGLLTAISVPASLWIIGAIRIYGVNLIWSVRTIAP